MSSFLTPRTPRSSALPLSPRSRSPGRAQSPMRLVTGANASAMTLGGLSTVRSVIKDKQRELEMLTDDRVALLEQRIRDLEDIIRSKDVDLDRYRTQLGAVEQDFNYNLALIKERDAELERLEREYSSSRRTVADQEERVRRAEARADDLQARYTEETAKLRQDMQALQDKLRREVDQARADGDAEITRVRTELSRNVDAQLRSSRAAEQEWRRKAEALAQELLRAQELGETTQQQLKSAMAQADGSLQSMRELEGSYAALDAEMGRARAQLERERDEHAATKRLLQRAAQEAQEMAEEVRVLNAKGQEIEEEVRVVGQRLERAEGECAEWWRRCQAAESALRDAEGHVGAVQERVVREAEVLREQAQGMQRENEALASEVAALRAAHDRARAEAGESQRRQGAALAAAQARLDDAAVEVSSLRGHAAALERQVQDQAAEIRALTSRAVAAEEQVAGLAEQMEGQRRRLAADQREVEGRAQLRWQQEVGLLQERLQAREREVAGLERRARLAETDLQEAQRRMHALEMELIGNRGHPNGAAPRATGHGDAGGSHGDGGRGMPLWDSRGAVNEMRAGGGAGGSGVADQLAQQVRDMARQNARLKYDVADLKDKLSRTIVEAGERHANPRTRAVAFQGLASDAELTGSPARGASGGLGRERVVRELERITKDLAKSPALHRPGAALLGGAATGAVSEPASPNRAPRGYFEFGENVLGGPGVDLPRDREGLDRSQVDLGPTLSEPAPDPDMRVGLWSVGHKTQRRALKTEPRYPRLSMDLSGTVMRHHGDQGAAAAVLDRAEDRVRKAKQAILDAARYEPPASTINANRAAVRPGTAVYGTEVKSSKLQSFRKVLSDTRSALKGL